MKRIGQGGERPLSTVPTVVLALLVATLALQVAWQSARRVDAPSASDLPPAPTVQVLRLAGMGEPAPLSRLTMVWLQAFDSRGDNAIPYQRLDYTRLVGWLRAVLAVDPRGGYPLFMAARVYAENNDPSKMRQILEFVSDEFEADPRRRWPALAHAALLAKHRLHDLPLARRYAAAIQRLANDRSVPLWAKQMEIFILEDMNEFEAARVMLGGLLATGQIRDPGERRYLQQRLELLERKVKVP